MLFEYTDPFSQATIDNLPENLRLSGAGTPRQLLLVRLLSGALTLQHVNSNAPFRQSLNYFSSDFVGFRQHWKTRFPPLISEGYDAANFSVFIDKTKLRNKTFFDNLLMEISNFCWHEHRKSHTTAFIHLYRALEYVSYAFPLIYVTHSDEFYDSFSFLSKLMGGDNSEKKTGELGFFKKFVNTLYENDPIRDIGVDVPIPISDEDLQKKVYKLLRNCCNNQMLHEDTVENEQISINFPEFGSLIITLRNRFFHFSHAARNNIKSNQIVDSDMFFSLLNRHCAYWIATIYLGILSSNVRNFEQFRN